MEFKKPALGEILQLAYHYWRRTLLYQVLFTLIYFSLGFTILYYSGVKLGLLDLYAGAVEKLRISSQAYVEEVQKIGRSDAAQRYYWIILFTLTFLYPLNLGLMKIFRKLDLNEKTDFHDLFAGYLGINFLIYTSFHLFWIMVFNLVVPTFFLAILWVLATLFAAPLMFFRGMRTFECISISLTVLRKYPLEILITVFLAVVIKYIGIFSLVGALFTFPVWNAFIYALYKSIFVENTTNEKVLK